MEVGRTLTAVSFPACVADTIIFTGGGQAPLLPWAARQWGRRVVAKHRVGVSAQVNWIIVDGQISKTAREPS